MNPTGFTGNIKFRGFIPK